MTLCSRKLRISSGNEGLTAGANMAETEIIFSLQESLEGGFEARALGHPIFTKAESMDELREMVREAVRCHFDPRSVPKTLRLEVL